MLLRCCACWGLSVGGSVFLGALKSQNATELSQARIPRLPKPPRADAENEIENEHEIEIGLAPDPVDGTNWHEATWAWNMITYHLLPDEHRAQSEEPQPPPVYQRALINSPLFLFFLLLGDGLKFGKRPAGPLWLHAVKK